MKKLFLFSAFALSFTIISNSAKSQVVGQVDHDGEFALSISSQEAKAVLERVSHFTEPQPFQPTEITLSTMALGEICLTGYIKNPVGHIVHGFRIMCIQDDANNLIVKPGSRVERIHGRKF